MFGIVLSFMDAGVAKDVSNLPTSMALAVWVASRHSEIRIIVEEVHALGIMDLQLFS